MTKPRVYVETTIPSFYYEFRTDPEVVARRNWTRDWWDGESHRYELVTSPAVLGELSLGDPQHSAIRLSLIRDLPMLPLESEVEEIVCVYIEHKVMPADPGGDALHLALASHHKCDYLITWNCRHLANANKFGHIRRINAWLGLFVPILATPLEMLGEDDAST